MTARPEAHTASITGPKIPCSSPLPWSISTGGVARSMPKGVPGASVEPSGAYVQATMAAPSSVGTSTRAASAVAGSAYGRGTCTGGNSTGMGAPSHVGL